jgi:hypothetical protein
MSRSPSKQSNSEQLSSEQLSSNQAASSQAIANMTETDLAALAKRLEQDEYTSAFEGLKDWHLLRAIAFQRPDMVQPYIYLLDLEPYDEA